MADDKNKNLSESDVNEGIAVQAIITDQVDSIESPVDALTKRQGIYNDLIDAYKKHYEEKSKHNRVLKIVFFSIIMGLIALLVIGLLVLCICIALKWESSPESIAVIITSVGTILSTIIALPTIICNYLFHKKEDKDLLDFIVELNKKDT